MIAVPELPSPIEWGWKKGDSGVWGIGIVDAAGSNYSLPGALALQLQKGATVNEKKQHFHVPLLPLWWTDNALRFKDQ